VPLPRAARERAHAVHRHARPTVPRACIVRCTFTWLDDDDDDDLRSMRFFLIRQKNINVHIKQLTTVIIYKNINKTKNEIGSIKMYKNICNEMHRYT